MKFTFFFLSVFSGPHLQHVEVPRLGIESEMQLPAHTIATFGIFLLFIYLFCLFAISWATPAAYGGSQARGLIGAVAAGLHHSHSNTGSEPHL